MAGKEISLMVALVLKCQQPRFNLNILDQSAWGSFPREHLIYCLSHLYVADTAHYEENKDLTWVERIVVTFIEVHSTYRARD